MGIKSFTEFLKKYVPNVYFEAPLESLAGKRLAIDMGPLLYSMMSVATCNIVDYTNLLEDKPDSAQINRDAIDKILSRLELYLNHGIIPICVFDGKPHQLKITKCLTERRSNRDKIKQKMIEAAEKLYSEDILLRDQSYVDQYAKYRKQYIEIDKEFVDQVIEILTMSGFTIIHAENIDMLTKDAEAVCAALCNPENGYCYAAVSNDSDFHVYGGNIQITDIYAKYTMEGGRRVSKHYIKLRSLDTILKETGLSFDSFQDLCILMGTDFNKNIKGAGPVKCWAWIQKYNNIPNLAHHQDLSSINYTTVKQIYQSAMIKLNFEITELNFNKQMFGEYGRDTFDRYELTEHGDIIARLLANC